MRVAVSGMTRIVSFFAAGAPPKYLSYDSKVMWSPATNSVILYGPVPIGFDAEDVRADLRVILRRG